jgi:hypothetical protein
MPHLLCLLVAFMTEIVEAELQTPTKAVVLGLQPVYVVLVHCSTDLDHNRRHRRT